MSNANFERPSFTPKAPEITEREIKKRTVFGIILSIIQKIGLQFVITSAGIILARILAPEDFGIFGILAFLNGFIVLFADFGLSPALIQKKERVTKKDFQTVFTFRLFFSLVSLLLIFFLAPFISSYYNFRSDGWLVRVFFLYLLFAPIKAISLTILDRKIDYPRSLGVQTIEFLCLEILFVLFALLGFGAWSFVWATFLSQVFGLFIFYFASPWDIRFYFDKKIFKKLFHFGYNFQINNIVGMINGAVVPVLVGSLVGTAAVGYVNWAGGLAVFTQIFQQITVGVLFQAGSRAQENRRLFRLILEKMLMFSALVSFPLVAILVALAPQTINIVYTRKWMPALGVLYILCFQHIFIAIGNLFISALKALGEIKEVRNISIFWAGLQWILSVPLVLKLGFEGVAWAGLLVSSTFFIPFWRVRKRVDFSFWQNVLPFLFYSLVTGIVTYLFLAPRVVSLFSLLAAGMIGGIIFLILLIIFSGKSLWQDWRKIRDILEIKIPKELQWTGLAK